MSKTAIKSTHARRVWDSRGRPTVEAEITLRYGASGRAIAPAGASKGTGEAVELRDGGQAFGGFGVEEAVAAVNGEIATALKGKDAADQDGLDKLLIGLDGTADKSRLGGNAMIAVSMAAAHAAAAAHKMPLWRYLRGREETPGPYFLPLPEVQIFGGGVHAGGRVDIQDYMVTAIGADSFTQALDWTADVYRAAAGIMAEDGKLLGVADEGGLWPDFDSNEEALDVLMRAIEAAGLDPGRDMAISLDIAASQFGTKGEYRLARDGRTLDSDGLSGQGRHGPVHLGRGQAGAGDRRRLPGHQRGAHPRRGPCRRRQRRADQAQPGRHVERNPGGVEGRPQGRFRRHHLGPLR